MIRGYSGRVEVLGVEINIKEWELGVNNKITVPDESVIRVREMAMGQFGTLLDRPRVGQHIMMFQNGQAGFLAEGSLLPVDGCSIAEHRIKIEKKFTIEAQQ